MDVKLACKPHLVGQVFDLHRDTIMVPARGAAISAHMVIGKLSAVHGLTHHPWPSFKIQMRYGVKMNK
ncbi:predicted protein [Uncinocarpus reesii 1704]|uniref:Uncharacterized protein n=1 Tax=Uncinocarpus reesii (strain UAMH 1704) TaxID=336963 RepID=C4JZV0_UNCRE|nr:uncharacterized protein UREG_07701 [Uncinocarpus reesii 1704]EEP82836.1 predicted protein [Uncinocarpus reesii 1704]